jgi:hypothetical protein
MNIQKGHFPKRHFVDASMENGLAVCSIGERRLLYYLKYLKITLDKCYQMIQFSSISHSIVRSVSKRFGSMR